jgi:purine-binding chemotaxis protein CheW
MVAFSLAGKDYAIDILKVKEIAKAGRFTYVPNTSPFVLGVYNLRGEIIPIIDLHKRFAIKNSETEVYSDFEKGFIILNIENKQIGIIIDCVSRVVSVQLSEIQEPPQMMTGIGSEYIKGVIRNEEGYLIMLNIRKLFDPKELQKIIESQ